MRELKCKKCGGMQATLWDGERITFKNGKTCRLSPITEVNRICTNDVCIMCFECDEITEHKIGPIFVHPEEDAKEGVDEGNQMCAVQQTAGEN